MRRLARYNPEFLQALRGRRFRHPETGNQVLFQSLPTAEQQKVYGQWSSWQQQQQQQQQKPQQDRETPQGREDVERKVSDFLDPDHGPHLPDNAQAAMQLMMLDGVLTKADEPHYQHVYQMVESQIDERADAEEKREKAKPWWKRMLNLSASQRVAVRWTHGIFATQVRLARSSPKYTKLHIFDFDGTLFRSPGPPEGRENPEEWWSNPESLEAETVGESPDPDMWHPESVKAMRDAIEDPDSYVVVMTGRHRTLQPRLQDILDSNNLRPDELITNREIGNTSRYKRDEMLYLLHQFPNVRQVDFWEDRKADLKGYQRLGDKIGVRFVPHHVENFEDKDPPYVGVFLTPENREQLLRDFPPKHGDVRADHATLAFSPSDEETSSLLGEHPVGTHLPLKVVGYAEDERAQVVKIELPEGMGRPDGGTPHVTISLAPGTEAAYSNELVEKARPVELKTYEGYMDKGPRQRAPARTESPEGEDRRQVWRNFLDDETHNPAFGHGGVKERVKRRTLYDSGGAGRQHVMREWSARRR